MEILKANQLDDIIKSLNFRDADTDKIEDQQLNSYLRYVHVLNTHQEEIKRVMGSLNIEDLFYSKYYWLKNSKRDILSYTAMMKGWNNKVIK